MRILVFILIISITWAGIHARSHYHPGKTYNSPNRHPAHKKPDAPKSVENPKPAEDAQKSIQNNGNVKEDPAADIRRQDDREEFYHPNIHPGKPTKDTGVDWMATGQAELAIALNSWPKWQKARNVIYFIGDGMGVSTFTAGRIFKAQKEGKSVTEAKLSWETFPATGLIKTYNTDQQTPDSAGTATAFACGEKAKAGVIGVNENVQRDDCSAVAGNELRSIVHYAQDEGKWSGIVTTTRITHATPASAYAHSPSRSWERDSDVPLQDRDTCWDIARQLINNTDNKILRVVLGGGRREFIPEGTFDDEYPTYEGDRTDGRDLRQEWRNIKSGMGLVEGTDFSYVEDKAGFDSVDAGSIQYLMGLFEPSHMKYEADRLDETGDVWAEPSLAEMVKKSLDILKRGPEGYVLYVEGGRIDHAHHDNNAHRSLQDVIAMHDAVQVAMNETSEEDTLIIVTADHSHVFSMAGYQQLENDILGKVVDQDNSTENANDFKPYLTLGYANGPGFLYHRSADGSYINELPRKDLSDEDTFGRDYQQDGPVPLSSETHGGEDVALYARGPMSHLFNGQHEQHYIAHAAMYASCLGWNKDFCINNPPPPGGINQN